MELVSVIVPVYNVKKYLPKCVDSIINQTYRNIEVVLVDDGSTDGSSELCDRLALQDSRITVIHKNNSGPSAARNSGIKAALGNYILFVDSDDYIAPSLISETLEKAIVCNADIVMFDAESVDENGGHIDYFPAISEKLNFRGQDTPEVLLALPSLWNKLYKKELFIKNNIFIPENISIGEDFTVNTILLSLSSKTVCCDKTLYFYVQHDNSLMAGTYENSKKALRNADLLIACKTIKDYFVLNGKYDDCREVLDYLAIYYILTAVVRLNKTGTARELQLEMTNYVTEQCPRFKKNRYYRLLLSGKQKILFFLLKHKLFRTLHFVLALNRKLTGR